MELIGFLFFGISGYFAFQEAMSGEHNQLFHFFFAYYPILALPTSLGFLLKLMGIF